MEKVKIDDFTRYKYLSSVEMSKDGKNACFAVHEADLEDNRYNSNLWLYRIEENKLIKLTSFNKEGSFIWDSNEEVLFPGMRNPEDKEKKDSGEDFTVYYRININGGEAREAFRISRSVNTIKKVDKTMYVFKSTYNPYMRELDKLDEKEKDEELKRRKEEKDYEVLEEIPYWSNGDGFISKNRERLYVYDSGSGCYKALTPENVNVEDFNISPGGKNVVFIGTEYEGRMDMRNSVFICDIEGKTTEKVSPDDSFYYNYAAFIDSGRIVCSGSDMKSHGINENEKFYIIDIHKRTRTCITPELDSATWNSVGSDCRYGGYSTRKVDGGFLYFVTTEGGSSYLNKIDGSGKIDKLTAEKGSVDVFSVNGEDILFIGLRGMNLQELYKLKDGREEKITGFNDWVYNERILSYPEHLSITTENGFTVDGWVLKPANFDKNKKYPAILDIHGGPKAAYGEVFFHEMQYWAGEGYFVFFCNPRGSDGKGDKFADIRGKYGTVDYEDIMGFTDKVLQVYTQIDAGRVGVTGGSYGGYMTNWIIGHTNRFKAAASQRSISNWISKFGTTDIGYFFVDDQNCGTPWNPVENLWEHSPLKYADKVNTPTLFLHSDEDYRCYIAEGLQMFTALKYHGVESRLCLFHGENHELSRSGKPKHKLRRLKEITDWFQHYLK